MLPVSVWRAICTSIFYKKMLDTMVLLTHVGRRDRWEPPTGSVGWSKLTTRVDTGPHSQHACKYVCGTLLSTTRDGCTASPCRVRLTQCWEQWSAVCACTLPHCAECTPCLAAATAAGFSSVMYVCYTVSSVVQLPSRQRSFPSMQAAHACKPNCQTCRQAHTSSMHQA